MKVGMAVLMPDKSEIPSLNLYLLCLPLFGNFEPNLPKGTVSLGIGMSHPHLDPTPHRTVPRKY